MNTLRFLVDVNLPKHFKYFNNNNFEFVIDINSTMTDTEIWNYALKNDLVVLTKDTDFYTKALVADKTPKIIHFQLPNASLSELHKYFELNWEKLKSAISKEDFIIAKSSSFEIINLSD